MGFVRLERRTGNVESHKRKKAAPALKKTDRRVARTQKRLREALHSLIHERDYDSIAVKEILDRADVGRSAFWSAPSTKYLALSRLTL
jgi:AcrR family transcriptional regulator